MCTFIIIIVAKAVNEFIAKFGLNNCKSIQSILTGVDSEIQDQLPIQDADPALLHNNSMLKEIESMKAENQALKGHLMRQLEEMRQENAELKRSLDQANASCVLVNDLKSQIKELKEKLEASKDVTVDLKIKHFNAIPKNLQQFHEQMRNGDDTLPPFSQLDIYRTNKSTKGAYCKRKAI